MNPDAVEIVLVRAARAANVAAACRAMKNMGLRSLRLVGDVEGLGRREVRALAYGAWDVLDAARPAASLAEAVAESTLVAATSGRSTTEAWTPRRLALEAGQRVGPGRLSIVFGPEATGLSNEELALCHLRVAIPAHPAQPSLNLAQAVLIVAYEIWLSVQGPQRPPEGPRATAGQIEEALAALRLGLLGIGYLNPANPEAILAEIRGLVTRARPTPREIALLRGLARQIHWAAGRIARGGEADG